MIAILYFTLSVLLFRAHYKQICTEKNLEIVFFGPRIDLIDQNILEIFASYKIRITVMFTEDP